MSAVDPPPRTSRLPPVHRLRWAKAFRIIPTRFPPIALFERICDPAAWEVLAEIESLTNPRIRSEIGEIACVPTDERVAGPGASWVMGAFAHRAPSRFSDGTFGVYYCANRRATAIAETRWHMGRFYAATREPPIDIDMRVLVGSVDDRFHDLRGRSGAKLSLKDAPRWRQALDPLDYTRGQALGRQLFSAKSRGVVYPSVRDSAGQCLGAMTPRAVGIPQVSTVLSYHWNGERIDRVFDYSSETWNE